MNTLRILRPIPFRYEPGGPGATSPTTNGGFPDTDLLLIAGVIAKRSVCVDCLAGATGQAVTQVDEAFASIRTTLEVISEVALCDHCLKQTVVHRLV